MIKKIIYKLQNTTHGLKKLSYIDSFAYLKPNDIAIDCGANVGKITERMVNQGAFVYAFEPNPYAFEVLKNKFQNNRHVQCINKGVLDRDAQMKLYLHKNATEDQIKWSTGSSLLKNKSNISENHYTNVDLIDLGKFIQELEQDIALLKIDVEGVECQILNNLIDSGIIKKIKLILVETHDKRMPELRKETKKLKRRIRKEKIKNINLNWI